MWSQSAWLNCGLNQKHMSANWSLVNLHMRETFLRLVTDLLLSQRPETATETVTKHKKTRKWSTYGPTSGHNIQRNVKIILTSQPIPSWSSEAFFIDADIQTNQNFVHMKYINPWLFYFTFNQTPAMVDIYRKTIRKHISGTINLIDLQNCSTASP